MHLLGGIRRCLSSPLPAAALSSRTTTLVANSLLPKHNTTALTSLSFKPYSSFPSFTGLESKVLPNQSLYFPSTGLVSNQYLNSTNLLLQQTPSQFLNSKLILNNYNNPLQKCIIEQQIYPFLPLNIEEPLSQLTEIHAISTLKRRKKKMNKHKLEKRRKKSRALRKRLGKI